MSIFNKQTKQETIVYTIVWILLFLSPLISLIANSEGISDDGWVRRSLMDTYGSLLTFFVFFLVHNHVLAPMLVKHKRVKTYLICCVLMVSLFQFAQCVHRPNGQPLTSLNMSGPPPPRPERKRPPVDRHDLSMFMIIILMLGANLGLKYYFQNEEEKKRLAKLKEQSLKQELDYLRYQINPHFIMNTLNNIHALVDIDPKKAQECIIDLSKLMRYILYETNHEYVQASREVEFMANYVRLMRIRYNDKLTFDVSNADDGKGVWIPPLIFISFVENAFKHGVNYNKPSFITISSKIYTSDNGEPRLLYQCRNSKRTNGETAASKKVSEASGVGLTNIRRRLDLLFGSNYTLDIDDGETEFLVKMDIPVKTSEPVS